MKSTALDEFDSWKREGERKLQQLITFREGASQRLADAQRELAVTDAAIAALSALLAPEMSPLHVKVQQLEALLGEALGDLAPTHPLQARALEAVGRELRWLP